MNEIDDDIRKKLRKRRAIKVDFTEPNIRGFNASEKKRVDLAARRLE